MGVAERETQGERERLDAIYRKMEINALKRAGDSLVARRALSALFPFYGRYVHAPLRLALGYAHSGIEI